MRTYTFKKEDIFTGIDHNSSEIGVQLAYFTSYLVFHLCKKQVSPLENLKLSVQVFVHNKISFSFVY